MGKKKIVCGHKNIFIFPPPTFSENGSGNENRTKGCLGKYPENKTWQ